MQVKMMMRGSHLSQSSSVEAHQLAGRGSRCGTRTRRPAPHKARPRQRGERQRESSNSAWRGARSVTRL